MEETFDVITDNAVWKYDCAGTERSTFDDGVYRGVLAVFAGCNGTAMVITAAIERIGTGKWMLMNVFAPT